ncbi:unnamed protein product [Echinostoma caproni]|uniref:Uncharacterized protein n=1 Tax=Echinostoma caproni TaxID=27848 RepID=A0A183A1A7_9TREM|nr:unnamed protein product [Echinostoma caproni]
MSPRRVMKRLRPKRQAQRTQNPTNHKKNQKLRVVFDCAAKCAGIALNDRILQDPDLTTPLIEVQCRLRLGSVAVAANIEEMFMQVNVHEGQRDALRFWWWPDGGIDGPAQEYRITVHPFGE